MLIENQKLSLGPMSMTQHYWIPLFFMRRIIYAASLTLYDLRADYQILINAITSSLLLSFLLSVRPFQSWRNNLISIMNEITILGSFIQSYFFYLEFSRTERGPDEDYLQSYVFLGIIGGTTSLNCISLIYSTLKAIYQTIKMLI